jgi:hypothetical protein
MDRQVSGRDRMARRSTWQSFSETVQGKVGCKVAKTPAPSFLAIKKILVNRNYRFAFRWHDIYLVRVFRA